MTFATKTEPINSRIVILRKMPGGGSDRGLKKEIKTLRGMPTQFVENTNSTVDAKVFAQLASAIKEQQNAINTLRIKANLL